MKLQVTGIRKSYDGRLVLDECSCTFADQGVTALMGGNGSGKSTLLRICALLEQPDGGAISYADDDRDLVPDLALRRRITLVLPRVGLFNATAAENVAYGLAVRSVPREDTRERVRQALSFVGLERKAQQRALTLSSGESQRLGIARAFAVNPEFLFLDEPTASVDEENTVIVERLITDLKRQGRTTIVLTTHDREQAERLADHVLLLKGGRLAPMR